jgi:hypothetical protein
MVHVTLHDPYAVKQAVNVLVHLACMVGGNALAEHSFCTYHACAYHTSYLPFSLWQMLQSIMLAIFFSPRFGHVIDGVWRGRDIFRFYLQLYFFFVASTLMLFASTTPWVWRLTGIANIVRASERASERKSKRAKERARRRSRCEPSWPLGLSCCFASAL